MGARQTGSDVIETGSDHIPRDVIKTSFIDSFIQDPSEFQRSGLDGGLDGISEV